MTPAEVLGAALRAVGDCPGGVVGLLHEVLARCEVDTDAKVATASMRPGPRGGWVLSLGADFCARNIQDDADALALVTHEVMHAARGHFGVGFPETEDARILRNVALDVLVNATLLRRVLPEGAGLFTRVNPPDELGPSLLVPPRDLLTADARLDPGAERLAALSHADLRARWLEGGATREDVLSVVADAFRTRGARRPTELARHWLVGWLEVPATDAWLRSFEPVLARELDLRMEGIPKVVLLGTHGEPTLADPLGDLDRFGRGLSRADDAEQTRHEQADADDEALRAFARSVRAAITVGSARVPRPERVPVSSPVPTPGSRRDTVLLATGHTPTLWRGEAVTPGHAGEGVHLYLDLSGSTHTIAPIYMALARELGQALIRPAWSWSTEVFPLSEADIRDGTGRTTHGTDIACVVEHAITHRQARVLVLTDGHFEVEPAVEARVRRAKLDMVFLVHDRWAPDSADELGRVVRVPRLGRRRGPRPRPEADHDAFPF